MIEAVIFIMILTALLFLVLCMAAGEADDAMEDLTEEGRD